MSEELRDQDFQVYIEPHEQGNRVYIYGSLAFISRHTDMEHTKQEALLYFLRQYCMDDYDGNEI